MKSHAKRILRLNDLSARLNARMLNVVLYRGGLDEWDWAEHRRLSKWRDAVEISMRLHAVLLAGEET